MLDGLDDIAWDQLTHAYGSAADVPEHLRGLAEGDEDALHELFGTIWHQGTVYAATSVAVPFLIELLDAPEADPNGILHLLASIAEGNSYLEVHDPGTKPEKEARELADVAAAVAAVRAGEPVYRRLLTEDDEEIRAAATYLLGVLSADLPPPDDDPSPIVRASRYLAVGQPSPDRVAGWLADPEPLPRIAAALRATEGPEAPDEDMLSVLERDVPIAREDLNDLPGLEFADPLMDVVVRLESHPQAQIRLLSAWMEHPDPEVRDEAVYACETPLHHWRPAAVALAPALVRRLSDESDEVRRTAAGQLAALSEAARVGADELWATVQRGPVQPNTAGASALKALCGLRDPRAAEYLAGRLSERPYDHSGLDYVLDRLGGWAEICREPLLRLIPDAPEGNARIAVISAAGRLTLAAGTGFDDLVPAVRAQLSVQQRIATRVLGDVGPPAMDAVPELRKQLKNGDFYIRVNAARALWRIAGEVEAVIPVLRRSIDTAWVLDVVAEMGPAAAELADEVRPLLGSRDEWVAVSAAAAYWALTREAGPVLPVLLRHLRCQPSGLTVVRCLAEIGPAADAAVPALRNAVESPYRQTTIGSPVDWIRTDEEWAQLCADALARITNRRADP